MKKLLFSGLSRLRVRLAVIVAIALAPAGVLAIVQAVEAVESASRAQLATIEARALATVDARRATLLQAREASRIGANSVQKEMADTGSCKRSLDTLIADSPWATGAAVFDAAGNAVCGTSGAVNIADTPGWQTFIENPRYVLTAARAGRTTGKQVLMAYRPLASPVGDAFALGSSVAVDYLNDVSPMDAADINIAVETTMIDRSGGSVDVIDEAALGWLPTDRAVLQSYGDRKITLADSTGKQRTYFVSAIAPGRLWAVTSIEVPTFTTIVFTAGTLSILAPVLIWAIAVAVAYFAIDALVTRHVASLRRAAMRIGEGDLDAPIEQYEDAPTEIRELGGSVRAMRDKIHDREKELRTTLDLQHRLLLEVHHRVKNNLQTISSMINLESGRVRDVAGRTLMDTIQSRIHSLAMVHQNLYAAESLEEVALDQLTRDIAEHLEDSLGPSGQTSIRSLELDNVTAPPTLATPVALFLSEALSNAFKHAPTPADIEIELRRTESEFTVRVSNRLGPDTRDDERIKGLGFQLMKGFAKQIAGSFEAGVRGGRFEVCLTSPITTGAALFSVRTQTAS